MKILIISGFLGAGKTTFIRTMAQLSGKEFAVFENEYGGENIDGEILEQSLQEGKVSVWELTERCICCSAKGDFAASVLTIANSVDPEFLVIEPTGVGMLSKIMENIRQIEYERIRLLEPVTIVDGHSVDRYLREYGELYRDQVRGAAVIFLSKMENASAPERQRVAELLRAINPEAKIVTDHYSGMTQSQWAALLSHEAKGSEPGAAVDGATGAACDLPDTFSLDQVAVERPEAVLLMLEDLVRGRFGNVFRAKGTVRVKEGEGVREQMLRFDVADGLYSVIGEAALAPGKAVFIGTGIERQALRRILIKDLFKENMTEDGLLGRLSKQASAGNARGHKKRNEATKVVYAPKKND